MCQTIRDAHLSFSCRTQDLNFTYLELGSSGEWS